MDGGAGGRASASARRLAAPRSLKAAGVGPAAVTLKWSAPKGARPAYYVILRDGKSLGRTTRTSYTDSKVKAGATYRYAVRAYDKRKRAGALSSSVRVNVPAKPATPSGPPAPAPAPAPNAGLPPVGETPSAPVVPTPPTPPVTPPVVLTAAMVDRLFWRAGFGPLQADRDAWTGRPHEELVDWFLNTPLQFRPTSTPPKASSGAPADPRISDEELVLEWVDRMQRAINPLPDRLAFFWHRHWAVSRDDGSVSFDWAVKYRDRLLRYSDFAAKPALNFREMAYEITTVDAAMSAYLNLNANTKTKPNENYARELMELFCLGPTAPDGSVNYTQADIEGLTKALTGWRLDSAETLADGVTPNPNYGRITFAPGQFETAAKSFLGRTIPAVTGAANPTTNPASMEWGPSSVRQAVDIVLGHAQHAQFLIRKLWAEFIAGPIPQGTLDALIADYTRSGFQLRPVIRGILTHPQIFESLAEPNLIKPPIVYSVGVLRALGVPLRGNNVRAALSAMQQHPYRPPNVAGWEGGMSWLNTNTVMGRFDTVVKAQYMKYSNYYAGGDAAANYPHDIPSETAQAVFDRAYESVNRPWISPSTRDELIGWAASAATTTVALRRQRFYAVQAMILGGPDGQVM